MLLGSGRVEQGCQTGARGRTGGGNSRDGGFGHGQDEGGIEYKWRREEGEREREREKGGEEKEGKS